jgi:hypothetical protein
LCTAVRVVFFMPTAIPAALPHCTGACSAHALLPTTYCWCTSDV